jgi:hypothetical protein
VFLPTFIAEMVPFIDLAPSWTLAVFITTRARRPPPPIDHPAQPKSRVAA